MDGRERFFFFRLHEKGARERLRASVTLGDKLASWEGNLGATRWLEHLRIDGHTIEGPPKCGYPVLYFGKARHVVPVIHPRYQEKTFKEPTWVRSAAGP